MEGYGRAPRRYTVHREVSAVQDIRKRKESPALRNKVKDEETLKIYGGLREAIGMKTYLHGPMDYAKTLKRRFRVGDLDLPEGRKRYTSSRVEEGETAQT